MKAVILAGGKGTRLRPFTDTVSKPMVDINGKPLIDYVIKGISPYINNFLLVVGHGKESVMEYLKDGSQFGVKIRYVEQKEPLGTAHAIACVENYVNERFIVLNGDIIFDFSLMKELIKKKNCITVKEVAEPWRFGVIAPEGNRVKSIVEKPQAGKEPSKLANIGIYGFTRDIFNFIRKTPLSYRGEFEITDSIQLAIEAGVKFEYLKLEGQWHDIGTIDDLIKARQILGKQ